MNDEIEERISPEFQEQIQRRFIRNTIRPFSSIANIEVKDDLLPVYRIEKKPKKNIPIDLPFTPFQKKIEQKECFTLSQPCKFCEKILKKGNTFFIILIFILVFIIVILLRKIYEKNDLRKSTSE